MSVSTSIPAMISNFLNSFACVSMFVPFSSSSTLIVSPSCLVNSSSSLFLAAYLTQTICQLVRLSFLEIIRRSPLKAYLSISCANRNPRNSPCCICRAEKVADKFGQNLKLVGNSYSNMMPHSFPAASPPQSLRLTMGTPTSCTTTSLRKPRIFVSNHFRTGSSFPCTLTFSVMYMCTFANLVPRRISFCGGQQKLSFSSGC